MVKLQMFITLILISVRSNSFCQAGHHLGMAIGTSYNHSSFGLTGAGAGVRFSYERGIAKLFSGSVTISGVIEYSSTSTRYHPGIGFGTYKYTWKNTGVLFRGIYYQEVTESFFLYGALSLGPIFTSMTESVEGAAFPSYVAPRYPKIRVRPGAFAGVVYQWSHPWSIYSELGYGMLWFSTGVRYKIKS